MDEVTRAYVISSIRGVFDKWFWPPELFCSVFEVIPSCRLSDKEKYDEKTGSPRKVYLDNLIGEGQ